VAVNVDTSVWRRMKYLLLAALVVVLSVSLPPGRARPSALPNIIVIMVDDLDWGVLNATLNNGGMPNYANYFGDAAATIFDQSFVSDSLCCPSRATFLTGQYAHNQ
jgi:N-acetylglucosamine-6-sulfatase